MTNILVSITSQDGELIDRRNFQIPRNLSSVDVVEIMRMFATACKVLSHLPINNATAVDN